MVEPYTAGKKRKSVSVSKFYLFDIAVARTLQNISVPYEGNEVDFCLDDDLAIEVKSTDTVTDKHLKGLKALREEEIFKRYIVVCREEFPRKVDGIEILPWKYFFESLWA